MHFIFKQVITFPSSILYSLPDYTYFPDFFTIFATFKAAQPINMLKVVK